MEVFHVFQIVQVVPNRAMHHIYVTSEKSSYDKVLSKPPYLPDYFVLFINLGHFVIIEKGFFLFLMPASLSQYRQTVGLFNNIFGNKEVH